MLDTRVKELEAAFHFNVSVPFELSRLAVPHMLAVGGGSILNIGSVAGPQRQPRRDDPQPHQGGARPAHEADGVRAGAAVRVNAVLPGAIETAALKGWLDTKGESARDEMEHNTPMRRNGVPEDVAPAVLYLCRPPASWVTGKLVEVDGGALSDVLPSQLPDL